MKNVLLTGSQGRVGSVTVQHLRRSGYAVRCVDKHQAENDSELIVADISDMKEAERVVEGMDAIIHLAASLTEDNWADILQHNIVATRNLYEAALKAGVKRILLASSHHVSGMYPTNERIDHTHPARPDSLYGLSKSFSEDLARYYWDKFDLETVAVRIGALRDKPEIAREFAIWLSPGDWHRLIDAALTTPMVGFSIVWGVSDNQNSWWSNPEAGRIGYRPVDNAGSIPVGDLLNRDRSDPAIFLQGGKRAAHQLRRVSDGKYI